MKDLILNEIVRFVKEHKGNILDGEWPFYETPFVGFAAYKDSVFEDYKNIIGPEHFTPQEIFEQTFEKGIQDGTVISIVLPLGKKVRDSNGKMKSNPSREWALSREFSDELMEDLALHMEKFIADMGHKAVFPMFSPHYKKIDTPKGTITTWSERHIAYVAGLGTFSLNDGFITEQGIAVRLTSMVTDLVLEPNERTADTYCGNCLFLKKGTCGACIKRCPAGALSEKGHDKTKCKAFVYGDESKRLAGVYGIQKVIGSGCGLCQTSVPCESKNPVKR